MKLALFGLAAAAALIPLESAQACAPPPPGWVQPTELQFLERSLKGTTDIVYGVVTKAGMPGEPERLKVIHVYRGTARKGDVIERPPGYGHPVPYCAGMMGLPRPQPVGTYGVFAFASDKPDLNFIAPKYVQMMIKQGWIRSAQAR